MKTNTFNGNLFGGKVLCTLFGHKFRTSKHITGHFREFECSVCREQRTNDSEGRIISLTPLQREINETLINIYRRKQLNI